MGRQYLYDVLHYNRLSEISEQEEVIRKLSADKELRAGIRSELRKLDTPDAYTIASLFSISHPVYSRRFYRLLTILQFAPFVLLGIVYITSSLYVLGILCTSVLVNMVLHYRSKARIQGYFFSIPQLWQLLRQAEKLAQIPLCASVHRDIQKTLQALHPLRKKLSTFRFSIRLESDIAIFAYFFTEIVNVFFCGKLFRFPRLSFYCRVDRNRLKRFSAISDWWMCFALFPNSGMGCLIMFYRKLAARVKRFMQKGFIIRL